MPNWVYNKITLTGSSNDLESFKQHINIKPFYVPDEEEENSKVFSFHSFITLSEDKFEEYHTTNGFGSDGRTGDTEFNWYNWNCANWDTKWDACRPEVEYTESSSTKELLSIDINFETAWSPPNSVFLAMSEQFPTIQFDVWWEEEQGFGQELELINGLVTVIKEWDIPQSHADYVEQDKEDSCICYHYENPKDWYDDCPREEAKEYVVEVITKYIVKANSSNDALEAAKAEEAGEDAIKGTEVIEISYADRYEVKEKENNEQ